MALLLTGTAIGFASCSSDDEVTPTNSNVTLPTPPYEAVSGKYEITSAGSPYRNIELGASGNYIVTRNYGSYSAAGNARKSLLNRGKEAIATRSTTYGNYVYGTFTDLGNHEYALEGFGTIRLEYTGENVTGIEITADGTTQTYSAEKQPTMGGDNMTNALCRTWRVEKVVDLIIDKETGERHEETVTPENTGSYEDGMAREVMFSKSGTYFISYVDGELELAEWKWKDRNAGTINYARDGEWSEDYVTLTFSGNRAIFHEVWDDRYEREEVWTHLVTDDVTDDTTDVNLPEGLSPLDNVFTSRLLKEVSDDHFIYEKGYLTQIVSSYDTCSFRYNYIAAPEAALPDVYLMDGNEIEYEAELNKQGFVRTAYRVGHETTTFTYNADGHITAIDDGREGRLYTLEWKDGDLVRMTWTRKSDGSLGNDCRYEYDGQPNSDNLMFYYKVFDVDLDEIQKFYYAGLLGKSTLHLPAREIDLDDNDMHTFVWTDNGFSSHDSDYEPQPDDEPETTFSFIE